MQQRRVFLTVLGGSLGAAVSTACGGSGSSTSGGFGGSGNGGAGGSGPTGTGGSTSSSTSSTTSSTTTSSSSTTSSSTSASSSSGGNCTQNPTGTSAGAASKYMANGLHQVSGTQFLVGYDGKGFYAMSSLCTHEFCNMNKSSKGSVISGGIYCKCHGSQFDDNGNVTNGPAQDPLANFKVELGCDMNLYVDENTQVPMGTRVKP